MTFSIIAAVDKKLGIGLKNALPWRLKGDMDHFKQITVNTASDKQNAVIMGSNTWASLPEKFRPLPERLNVVLSWQPLDLPAGVLFGSSLDNALEQLSNRADINEVFVIGGARVYAEAINHPACVKIYLTEIDSVFECDTFFPKLPVEFVKKQESELVKENNINYKFAVYAK
ncbi:MAG: dihydrofolate reductase [Patescibacteria group bacterium]